MKTTAGNNYEDSSRFSSTQYVKTSFYFTDDSTSKFWTAEV